MRIGFGIVHDSPTAIEALRRTDAVLNAAQVNDGLQRGAHCIWNR
jgi:hypothetical protein